MLFFLLFSIYIIITLVVGAAYIKYTNDDENAAFFAALWPIFALLAPFELLRLTMKYLAKYL